MQKIFIIFFLFAPFIVSAQSDSSENIKFKPRISGSADVYYRYNTNAPSTTLNNFTKFTNTQNTFALGMVSIKAADSFKRVSGVINIGFGQRIKEYNYTAANNSFTSPVKELYISYAATKNIKFTAGKWYKHIGYEMPDADANHNYSMSYLFSFSPMSFTGIKADILFLKKLNVMVGITNPADIFDLNYLPTKTFIAGIRFNTFHDRVTLAFNFQGYGGVSTPYLLSPGYYLYKKLQQYNVEVQFAASDKVDIVFDGVTENINDGSKKIWDGNVVYITYKWKPDFSITFRGEYIDDDGGLKIGTDIFAATLSGNLTINHRLRFIPEIRLDNAFDNIFEKGNFTSTGHTITGLLAAVYSFGN